MRPEKLISQILHPLLIIPVAAVSYLNIKGIGLSETLYWTGIWITINVIPTAIFIYRKGEKGFNISNSSERLPAFIVGLGTLLASLAAMYLLSAPEVVLLSGGIGLTSIIVFGLANTALDKVSIHTGSMTGAATAFIPETVSTGIILFIASLLVGWSRLKLNAHTEKQVIYGGLLGILCGSLTLIHLV